MRLLKIIFLGSGILTLIIVTIIFVLYYLTSNSLPNYKQDLISSEITDTVTISRDAYAIPYIEGYNNQDSFFALGYAHAQDRLWQMTLLRRIAQGRLAEIIGQDGVQNDILMRTLGIYSSAKKSESKQPSTTSDLLKSYSAGVNSYIKQITKNSLGRGSPEFFLFTPEISPWRPADSIALLKLIAFQSTNKAETEVLRTQILLAGIKPERYQDLFLEPPFINNTANKSISYLQSQRIPSPPTPQKHYKRKKSLVSTEHTILNGSLSASNIFAVMPSRSATGFVLAANDPHATLTSPSNFMLVNLKLVNGSITGGTIPGIPAIIIGRSKQLGWGISNAKIDDQDLFIEKLNPKNNLEYFTEFGVKKFQIKSEIIKIKNKKAITVEIKSTDNGPVLSSNLLGVNFIRPKGHELAISWTGLSENDKSIHSLISLMQAQTIAQAKETLPLLQAPGQNIMLVDHKNIEIVTAGAIPKRDIAHTTKGRIPALGWHKKNTWAGTLEFRHNPKIRNPKSGIVINTNNKTTDAPFPYHVSYDWGDSQRIIRANNLLKKRQYHTVSSFKEIQNDTISISAKILVPLLAKGLWFGQRANDDTLTNAKEQQALKMLSEWNGDMNQNNPEPLIFVGWLREFQRMVMIDELGSLYERVSSLRPLFLERVLRDKKGAAEWCDIKQTEHKETCAEIARTALTLTIEKLQRQFGLNLRDWRWGDPHLAIYKSQIVGSWPIISFFTNIVHEISGGDNTIMTSRMTNSISDQFIANYGSTLRTIYDFSNKEHSLFIISTGQSGHFLSLHYDDQSILWQREQYIPIHYDILDRQGGSTATTTFNPQSLDN